MIRKRSIRVIIGDIFVTLKFDGWPKKTIWHLFNYTSSFVHHFKAIGEFKLELKSGNAQFGSISSFFCPVWAGLFWHSWTHFSSWSHQIWHIGMSKHVKVAEDDIAFNLAILKNSLHLNDNTCFCSITQASKLVFGSLLAKNNFFVQFWTKNFASSRMADCGSGLPAEWPFRSQNAIEASDSPLPGGLWVKRLIKHVLCSLAYSDIAWCKLFLILTMKGLY